MAEHRLEARRPTVRCARFRRQLKSTKFQSIESSPSALTNSDDDACLNVKSRFDFESLLNEHAERFSSFSEIDQEIVTHIHRGEICEPLSAIFDSDKR